MRIDVLYRLPCLSHLHSHFFFSTLLPPLFTFFTPFFFFFLSFLCPFLILPLSPLSYLHSLTFPRSSSLLILLFSSPLPLSLLISSYISHHPHTILILTGKRDAGMGLKMGDMHYKSDSLVFSADSLR